jgi:hypothetical protein
MIAGCQRIFWNEWIFFWPCPSFIMVERKTRNIVHPTLMRRVSAIVEVGEPLVASLV